MITEILSIMMLAVSVGASASADGLGVFNSDTPKASIDASNIDDFYGNYSFIYNPSVNLLDYEHRLLDKGVGGNGVVNNNVGTYATSLIPVKPSTTYSFVSNGTYTNWFFEYDVYGNYLRLRQNLPSTFSTSSDAYYLRRDLRNDNTQPMLVEGSTLPQTYSVYSCTLSVTTPYHSSVLQCWYDDSLGMTSTTWSDSNMAYGFGYIHFLFDGNYALLQNFSEQMWDDITDYEEEFENMEFEPNAEDDYELGFVIDERLYAYAYFNVHNTMYSCDISYSGCYMVDLTENDSFWGSGYTEVPSFDYFNYEYPSNPYVIKVVAEDGYYLGMLGTSEMMTIGGNCTILATIGAEAYPGVGNEMIKSAYVCFQVPLNVDATISFTALARPRHTIVLQLNHAEGSFSAGNNGTFYPGEGFVVTLTADDGYGFNELTNSIFVEGASEYHVLYTQKVVGSLYSEVMVEITGGSTNITLNATALPYTQDYEQGFDNGRIDGMQGTTFFGWVKTLFDGMAGVFNIQIIPGITIGLLAFSPLLVVAIVAIVRIIRHD